MQISIYLFVSFLAIVNSRPATRTCPNGFDYMVKGSCFKYVNDVLLQHRDAKMYCEKKLNGRLAVLDTRSKMRKTLDFLDTIFNDEQPNGVPTAWVAGSWVKGTRRLRYDNGVENLHPHWMTPIFNRSTGKFFRFPSTEMFGKDATCVVASLWKRGDSNLGIPSTHGLYNVVCNDFYFTHPLCEVLI